jgi:hypothetical protein
MAFLSNSGTTSIRHFYLVMAFATSKVPLTASLPNLKDELRRYVTDLFRSGQATTVDEARALALEKIKLQMAGEEEQSNGTNGTNGVNGMNGDEQKYELKIPTKAIVEGTKTVRRELEKVCDITEEDS